MTYPRWNPASKHDIKAPRLPPPGTALQDSLTYLDSAPKLFQTLQEDLQGAQLKPLATVYSYKEDAPAQYPLSRDLCIVGVAPMSLGVVRKLLTDDDHDPNERVATDSCLHKCTVAVRRGDGKYVSQLDQKHILNSKSFAKFMQRLRQENLVAILGLDKYGRFGIVYPIDQNEDDVSVRYHEHDFYGSCFVGAVDDVKDFLRQGMSSSNDQEPASAPSHADEHTGDADEPMYRPPEDDDGDGPTYQPMDDSGTGLWQPPGSSGKDNTNDSNGDGGGDAFSWQPPGSNSNTDNDGGADSFSWQPTSTNDDGDFGGGDSNEFSWNGGKNDQIEDSKKRKRDDENHEENDANGDNFHSNRGAAAADAFYSGLTRTLDTRWQSRIYHMRSFNGWVKATQIQDLNPHTKTSGKNGPLRVLDLACGKGGDLGKWVLHGRGIQDYVGSDVARGSLKDAAERVRKMRNKPRNCTFTCADLGHDVPGRLRSKKQSLMQKLLTWSMKDEPPNAQGEPVFKMVRGGGIRQDQMFDVVSIQFAIHYMMQTRQRARRFFHTVSQLLEVGGNLICTTIDARVVIKHLMNLGADLHFDQGAMQNEPYEIKVGAGACRIRFEPEIVKRIFQRKTDGTDNCEELYGLEYSFTLVEGSDHSAGVGDAVNLPEWLTPIPVLVSLAREVGLELEYVQNFHEFYANRKDPSINAASHSSLYTMKVLNRSGSISADEWEISRLYCAVKFRKVREPMVELEDDEEAYESEDEPEQEKSIEIDPKLKMRLMPMAMMKAKKTVGSDVWQDLPSEEKTRLTEIELVKLAKA